MDIAEGCESTVIEELETAARNDCIYYTAPRINKVALARLLKGGGVIPGAELDRAQQHTSEVRAWLISIRLSRRSCPRVTR